QGPFRIGKVPVPVPKSSELLIRVNSCALNPVDWKQLKLGVLTFSFPLIVGCDVAGVVVGKGPTCTDKFHVGDEVIAYTRNGHNGAFAEFVVCREGVVARKPPHLAPHVAASIPLGLVTAAVALYLPVSHNLPWPDPNSNNDGAYILIWGASSSCGSWAVQLAAMSGMKVIGVAGPSNLEYVKSLGALHVLDRSKP
ncbi:GroES-like protein, partial [Gonapodya prolifera JEL478]